ncbi:MAG TPA: phosphotransferase [Gammaproteobacteria bacterium]|nr:phosphotransferase [Gammaproteobacteria bacterium]
MAASFETLPAERRRVAQAALCAAFGANVRVELEPISGGASGASVYRFEASKRHYVLRLEGPRSPLRNPHQYDCMQIAAEAGVAPRLHYLDSEAGAAVMDFLPIEPLANYPGGPRELAAALGGLTARLQETARFPALHDYSVLLERMLGVLSRPEFFAAGLLAPHRELFERIREAYPWGRSPSVSSHNDPNPQNVIFDGRRLWLIDWEAAYCNEPLTDLAILADNFAQAPELEGALLEGWSGRPPDAETHARLLLMRLLSRLYYAGLLLGIGRARAPSPEPDTDLGAPTPAEFGEALAQGRHTASSPETLYTLGKMVLASFLAGANAPGFEDALAAARG